MSFSKIFEKIIHLRLSNFLDKNDIISNKQYGFKKNTSTEIAVLDLNQQILTNIDSKLLTLGVFIDISKAFDSIRHDILLKKLYHYGIRGKMYNWCCSYLDGRQQYVSINYSNSSLLPVISGVPQGSILGPLFFNLFINDLINSSNVLKFILYADDTTLLASGKNINDITEVMNTELKNVSLWMEYNYLKINISKTCCILFGPKILTNLHNFQIFLNNEAIKRVDSTKFLGVIISSNLNWKDHIILISTKISKNLGIINKTKFILSNDIILLLYYALIFPYLIYCITIWGRNIKTHTQLLTKQQNHFARIYFKLYKFDHISFYLKKLKLLTVPQIYTMRILIFLFKAIVLNRCPTFLQDYIKQNSITQKITRHTQEFVTKRHRTQLYYNSIFIFGLKLWFNLPKYVKIINNICQFKKAINNLIMLNHFDKFNI